MRRVLWLPEDGPGRNEATAQRAFSRSMWISASRCLLAYVLLPVLGPLLGLTGTVGPVLGRLLGAVSVVAIVVSMRRLWSPTTVCGGATRGWEGP